MVQITQRALTLPQASEVVFVDATGNCDTEDHKVYVFLTQSSAGGIPIGCILSSSQKADIFSATVSALMEIFPVKIQPTAILTDDDLTERYVLQKIGRILNCFCAHFIVLRLVGDG